MKNIKLILASFLLIAFIGCEEDERDIEFINNAQAPSEVLLQLRTTQDNSGLVTMTPTAVGATTFEIFFDNTTEESAVLAAGESIDNIYAEGIYTVRTVATSVNGLTTEIEQELVVSFEAPQNLVVTIENDPAISKQVNVSATADFAMSYDVFFGEAGIDTPLSANIGESLSYTYAEAGTYTITVVAMGSAIETTTFIEENFEVTEILAPIISAATPPARADGDVISIFSDAYTDVDGTDFFPNWGQQTLYTAFDLNGDAMIQYSNLNYQGINIGESVDASTMETLHIDIWTPDATSIDVFPLPNGIQPADERFVTLTLVPNEWNSFDISLEDFTSQGLSLDDILQFKFVGSGTVFIDNLYFHRPPTGPSPVAGTWRMASEAGSLGVGPAIGDTQWFACDDACVAARACYFDDLYVFGADGSFNNILGAETWIEGWQGGSDNCGAPVAPYDGTATATYDFDLDSGQLIIDGVGAYIGLPKANNQGELPNVAVPSSITYSATLSDSNNVLNVVVESGTGVFWQYKLVREAATSPLEGTWSMAQEAGSLGVGPAIGDTQWFACDDACVAARACYFDDTYVFGADGSFTNVLGSESWIEGWQGGSDACGAPVAPYDGTAIANFIYDDVAGTLTINGSGAYLGIPKANNQGELPNVAVPDEIIYNITLSENDTVMNVVVESGTGVFWQYKLVKN
ncbi:MAG: PKD domain-containing protein [Winogradskyella sp.]|uniref:PKD domain-containing protein n=1 Tax=Winogradskyella sp. TaxID=1883156 RepID=UPI00385EFD0C